MSQGEVEANYYYTEKDTALVLQWRDLAFTLVKLHEVESLSLELLVQAQ